MSDPDRTEARFSFNRPISKEDRIAIRYILATAGLDCDLKCPDDRTIAIVARSGGALEVVRAMALLGGPAFEAATSLHTWPGQEEGA